MPDIFQVQGNVFCRSTKNGNSEGIWQTNTKSTNLCREKFSFHNGIDTGIATDNEQPRKEQKKSGILRCGMAQGS